MAINVFVKIPGDVRIFHSLVAYHWAKTFYKQWCFVPSSSFIPMESVGDKVFAKALFNIMVDRVAWVHKLVVLPKLTEHTLPTISLGHIMSCQEKFTPLG